MEITQKQENILEALKISQKDSITAIRILRDHFGIDVKNVLSSTDPLKIISEGINSYFEENNIDRHKSHKEMFRILNKINKSIGGYITTENLISADEVEDNFQII